MRHAILETVTISTDESNTEIRNQHLDPLKKILKEHAFPRQAAVGGFFFQSETDACGQSKETRW